MCHMYKVFEYHISYTYEVPIGIVYTRCILPCILLSEYLRSKIVNYCERTNDYNRSIII